MNKTTCHRAAILEGEKAVNKQIYQVVSVRKKKSGPTRIESGWGAGQLPRRNVFQAEAMTSAKALGWGYTWCV